MLDEGFETRIADCARKARLQQVLLARTSALNFIMKNPNFPRNLSLSIDVFTRTSSGNRHFISGETNGCDDSPTRKDQIVMDQESGQKAIRIVRIR